MIEKIKSSRFQPKASWLPLPKAVFRFGVADEVDAITRSSSNVAMEATATSLAQLHAILKERSDATHVEIDPAACTFSFQFIQTGSCWGGAPWSLLESTDELKTSDDPRTNAEALFNKVGLVRVSPEEAERARLEFDAVRRATGLVWRQFMLRGFDRAIAANEIAVFARFGSAIAPFEMLASDVWPLLTVLDWQHAIARDPEGLLYYSLHFQRARVSVSTARDENTAIRALAAELARNPDLKRADAETWCERSGFKLSGRAFRLRVWPKARGRAGLPEIASPGAKRKSVR
jgi:hypothetical protein